MCEREVNAAMGLSMDKINEYEPILDGAQEMAGQVVGGVPDRDQDLHENARTSVSVGPHPLAREGHSDFGCSSPIPLSSHSAPGTGGTQA
jgi:hypothetical protein